MSNVIQKQKFTKLELVIWACAIASIAAISFSSDSQLASAAIVGLIV